MLKFCKEFSNNVLKKFLNDPDPKLKDEASETLIKIINKFGIEHFTQTLEGLNPPRLKQIQNILLQQTLENKNNLLQNIIIKDADTNITNDDKFKLNKIGNIEIKKNKKNSLIFEDPKKKPKNE